MAVEDDADRATLLADFGVAAVYNAVSITVLFDNAYGVSELGGAGVGDRQPMATGRASDLTGVAEGDAITVAGADYVVAGPPRADGEGWIALSLHEAL